MKKLNSMDDYFAELEEKEELEDEVSVPFYGGGYEASRGDWEGACLARAEFESGQI